MVNRLIEPTSGRILHRRRRRRDARRHRAAARHRLRDPAGRACSRTRRSARTSRPCRGCSAGRRRASSERARGAARRSSASTRRVRAIATRRQLSGGERQRVGVARALAADPPIMLMDEPFGAVDPIVRERLQNEFLRLQEQLAKTILFVTHDIDEAIKMGDLVAVMQVGGHLAQFGPPAEILAEPASEFVARFVGADRGLKRLSLTRVGDLELAAGGHRARRRRRRRRPPPRARGPVPVPAARRRRGPADRLGRRARDPGRRARSTEDAGRRRCRRSSTGGRRSRTRCRCCSTPTSRPGVVVDRRGARPRPRDRRHDRRACATPAADGRPTASRARAEVVA